MTITELAQAILIAQAPTPAKDLFGTATHVEQKRTENAAALAEAMFQRARVQAGEPRMTAAELEREWRK